MNPPFIIDAHSHLGPAQAFEAHHRDVDDVIAMMDLLGIETCFFSAMPSLENDFETGHRLALDALERHPGRFRAYAVFNPHWPELTMGQVEELMAHPGFAGVKIHPAMHATAPDDPAYEAFWDFADAHALVVLSHTWSPDPAKPTQNLSVPHRMTPVLERWPAVRVILGHCGGRAEGMRQAIEVMNAFPNCYADLSGDCWELGQLEWLCGQVDPARILFGTDLNWIEPRYAYGHVLMADIPDSVKLDILRNNALRLFGAAS